MDLDLSTEIQGRTWSQKAVSLEGNILSKVYEAAFSCKGLSLDSRDTIIQAQREKSVAIKMYGVFL